MQLLNTVSLNSSYFPLKFISMLGVGGAFLGRIVTALPSVISTSSLPLPTSTPGCVFDNVPEGNTVKFVPDDRCQPAKNCRTVIRVVQEDSPVLVFHLENSQHDEVDLDIGDKAGFTERSQSFTATRVSAERGNYVSTLEYCASETVSGENVTIHDVFKTLARFRVPSFEAPTSFVKNLAVIRAEDGTYKLYFRPAVGEDNFEAYRVCNENRCRTVLTARNETEACVPLPYVTETDTCVPVDITPLCCDKPVEVLSTSACAVPCTLADSPCLSSSGSGSGSGLMGANVTNITGDGCGDFCQNGFQSNLLCKPSQPWSIEPTATKVAASTGAGLTLTSVLATIFGTSTPTATLVPASTYAIPTVAVSFVGAFFAMAGFAIACGCCVYFCRKYGSDLREISRSRFEPKLWEAGEDDKVDGGFESEENTSVAPAGDDDQFEMEDNVVLVKHDQLDSKESQESKL